MTHAASQEHAQPTAARVDTNAVVAADTAFMGAPAREVVPVMWRLLTSRPGSPRRERALEARARVVRRAAAGLRAVVDHAETDERGLARAFWVAGGGWLLSIVTVLVGGAIVGVYAAGYELTPLALRALLVATVAAFGGTVSWFYWSAWRTSRAIRGDAR